MISNYLSLYKYTLNLSLYNLNIKRFSMEEFPAFDEKEYYLNMSQFEFQAMPQEVFKDNVGIMKDFGLPLVTTCSADFILAINTNHGRPVAALHRYPAIGKKDA